MQKITRTVGVGVATAALVGAAAVSASAAETGDTAVTFEVTGGAIAIVPAATADFGTSGASGDTSIAGLLGEVTVTDLRGGTAGWVVSASSTEFTDGDTTSEAVQYSAPAPTTTGTVTAVGEDVALPMDEGVPTAVPVVNATAVTGNNTAVWDPTLTVTLPDSSTAGTYTGTVTTSVV